MLGVLRPTLVFEPMRRSKKRSALTGGEECEANFEEA